MIELSQTSVHKSGSGLIEAVFNIAPANHGNQAPNSRQGMIEQYLASDQKFSGLIEMAFNIPKEFAHGAPQQTSVSKGLIEMADS